MTNAKKIAYLNQYKTYREEAFRTESELRFWRQRAQAKLLGEKGIRIEPTDIQKRMGYYTRLLLAKYRACLAARLLLEDAIRQAPTLRHRLLLRLRFVDGLTLEAAADRIGLGPRQINRLQREALEAIEVPEVCGCVEQAVFDVTLERLDGIREMADVDETAA